MTRGSSGFWARLRFLGILQGRGSAQALRRACPFCTPSAARPLVSEVMYVKIKPLETEKNKKNKKVKTNCGAEEVS